MTPEIGSMSQTTRDQWSAKKYAASASFVPKMASVIVEWLDPQPTDRILDLGCGDGKFTANFMDKCKEVYGVDASPQFIKDATESYARDGTVDGKGKVSFGLANCTTLDTDNYAVNGKWDKVISNAAYHWILRNPSTRIQALKHIYTALAPGGSFTFELGGAGNVAEIVSASIPILRSHGFTLEEAREAMPWYFPDTTWMTKSLESIGFKVQKMELVYRPTKLEPRTKTTDEDGQEIETGGVVGWVRLMMSPVLDEVEKRGGKTEREQVVQEICEAVEWSCNRPEGDGGEWLGYMRLRGVAVKA